MAEALAKVKRELGPNALIVNTRTVAPAGVLGRLKRETIEITVSIDDESLAQPAKPDQRIRNQYAVTDSAEKIDADSPNNSPRLSSNDMDELQDAVRGLSRGSRLLDFSTDPTRNARPITGLEPLDSDIPGSVSADDSAKINRSQPTRRTRHRTNAAAANTCPIQSAHQQLIQAQVGGELADALVKRVRSELSEHERSTENVRAKLAEYVRCMLPPCEPIDLESGIVPRKIAVVGPTGVGKTTTIAKLAAHFKLREHRSVGIINTDTHRIGATEQLRIYAGIIDVPLEVVSHSVNVDRAIKSMRDHHVILIDTTGHGPHDSAGLQETRVLLERAGADEVHLVLPGTASLPVMSEAVQVYRRLGINRVILSKADEALGFGAVLTCLQNAEASLSYITTGQNIAEDIEKANGERLTRWIVSPHREHPSALDAISSNAQYGIDLCA